VSILRAKLKDKMEKNGVEDEQSINQELAEANDILRNN
jgi:hypothetical protein